ncbi:phosphatidylglycerol lysyltransferase domain-containing protein, partial [Frankia casuarinae]
RIPDAPTGVSELILSTAVRQFVGEKTPYLHFGLTPFTSLDPKHRLPGHSPFVDRFVRWLGTRAEWIYPAQSQVAYKLKWQPDLIQPEYVAFQDGVSLSAVWRLMRVTKAVSLRRGRKSVTRRPASPHE